MTRTRMALSLVAFSMVGWLVSPAQAQPSKTASGTVTAAAADSVSVMVGANTMKFSVDGQTKVEAAGAGTKTRRATAAGKAGPALGEIVKVGQRVTVGYQEMSGMLHASMIRVSPAGSSSGSTAGPKTLTSTGTVKSVTATSLSITGSSGGGGSFDQTFTIDATTKVIGKGLSTVTKGKKNLITDLLATGDRVSVSYREAGGSLHATEVRVTTAPR